VESANSQDVAFEQSEIEHLGYSHAEIGNFLGGRWNLPETICDSIKNHHSPHKSDADKKLSAIVHLSDYMTQKFQIADFYWDNNYVLDDHILDILGFGTMEKLDDFILTYKSLFEEEANTKIL